MKLKTSTGESLELSKKMLKWSDPIDNVKGLSPLRSRFLNEQGFMTVGDLLLRAPLRFIDRRASPPFSELHNFQGHNITAVGTIESVGEKGFRHKRRLVAMIGDGSGGYLSGVWFKSYRFLTDELKPGRKVAFSGRVGFYDGPQIAHPQITYLDNHSEVELQTGMIPVYPSGEEWTKHNFPRAFWRRLIRTLIEEWDGEGPYIPGPIQEFENLPSLHEVIKNLHQPIDAADSERALAALKFVELFHHQLLMIGLRMRRRQKTGIVIKPGRLHKKFIAGLPFTLSTGQQQVISEIVEDFQTGTPMYRLLQGEVGSGKTAVALAAAATAADCGKQTLLMAPTELLARQHYRSAIQWLEPCGIKPVLLVAGRNRDELRQALYAASAGEAGIIIGTHALFQERVKPADIGLVIIDEQQRFGVDQRSRLVSKGVRPHVLMTTATPIPRTLALTYYSDIDLSILQPREDFIRRVRTRVVHDNSRDKVLVWMRDKLIKGERGYMVYPVIDEGSTGLESVVPRFEMYRKIEFKDVPVAMMHGRQSIEQRIDAMEAFRQGEVRLLMSTAVVEVGVDVPEATLMVIENAERFGLAQIHQLRGRIGRQGDKGVCILLTKELPGAPGFERLKKLEQSDDGMALAEEDLRMRGSGEPLGVRQSGMVRFQFADISADMALLKRAHNAAQWLLERSPKLEEFPALREKLLRDYRTGPRTIRAG